MLEFLLDPANIFSDIGSVFTSIGSLFSDNRVKLTHESWLASMPGNGYWTSLLRNHLERTITYDVDIKNVESYSQNFIHMNLYEISNGKWQNLSTLPTSQEWNLEIVSGFYKMLELEKQGKMPKHIYDSFGVTSGEKLSDSIGKLISTDILSDLFSSKFLPVFIIGIILIIILLFKK